MVKTKISLLAALLLCVLSLSAQNDYSWRRVLMDGSRTRGENASVPNYPTVKKINRIIEDAQPQMAHLKEVIATSSVAMSKFRPQSPLTNWLADLMVEDSERQTGIKADVSIMNLGGIRTDMPKGDVFLDDIVSMFPFKNSVELVRLPGSGLLKILNQMAHSRFEAIGNIKVRASKAGVESAMVGGEPLEMDRIYTLITNSFLLEGGDEYYLAKDAVEVIKAEVMMQEFILSFIRHQTQLGKPLYAQVDDRVVLTDYSAPLTKKSESPYVPEVASYVPKANKRLTILHTNDTHSHIEPIRGGKNDGLGGVAERAAFIDSVRLADGKRNVLVLDAGDFEQGTSYFNVFGGKVDIEALNAMRYDVTTCGNHEFDNGDEDLAKRMKWMKYDVVLANYSIDNQKLSSQLKPYVIVRRGGMKIGIVGVLADVTSSVEKHNAQRLHYLDPAQSINKWSSYLKNERHCDLVIVLSHCGFSQERGGGPGDIEYVKQIHDVDIIIGGHTHTDLPAPVYISDADGRQVMIVTDFCHGLYVGQIDI